MGNYKKFILLSLLFVWLSVWCCSLCAQTKEVKLKLVETSDIHGNYLPYNYMDHTDWGGGLSRISAYVKAERTKYGSGLLLFDNGDMIEGQPLPYYYNYIDTFSTHVAADMMNYMRYDLGNLGNHEIEAGLPVLNRWIRDCRFPVLAANIVWKETGEPFGPPYAVFERSGVRIAVLGLSTAATPAWVCKSLWDGLMFLDLEEEAKKWISWIKANEKADIIVGLFHSGKDTRVIADRFKDDVSLEIARNVPGFDVIMMGHDHNLHCEKVANLDGDSVLLINPGSSGLIVGEIDLSLTLKGGVVTHKNIEGQLVDVGVYAPDKEFVERYATQHDAVKAFVSEKIGVFTEKITTRPAYFGPSAFVDFIHSLQLHITGADISFASPLSFDASIEGGDIRISDTFRLYRYKNLIYTMSLTGREVKDYLEESYARWTNQMTGPDDHLLLLQNEGNKQDLFANLYYFFDSAAGIIYVVDVSKPRGEKISILCMSDGKPFEMDQSYQVALTSYRGNGGGELLTKGAGLSIEELDERILAITDKDFLYYLIDYIKQNKVIHPRMLNHWKFVPDNWVRSATERDYRYLFGGE